MKKASLLHLIQSLFVCASYCLSSRNFDNGFYYSVEIDYQEDEQQQTINKRAEKLAHELGFELEGQIGELKGHYTFSKKKNKLKRDIEQIQEHDITLKNVTDIKWYEQQKLQSHLFKRDDKFPELDSLNINDPEFRNQWHLYNRNEKEDGNDINVVPVWLQGITGEGINVCIIDDGLDYEHPDLKDNFFKEGSYDFNEHQDLPKPTLYNDNHGTRCAGQVAAVVNDVCGVGIAYKAKVSGVRILSGSLTDADEAASLNYKFNENHIYSCSWGPSDDGQTCEGPSSLVARAFKNGVEKGRNGLGSIFVFATGNGGLYDDNCNFDGYTNSIYTISIGAIDSGNQHPTYSEACSAQIAVTYSSGQKNHITTTDVNISNLSEASCTSNHGGTSAAAPIAAGIFALVLNARPDLTWRDLQRLAIESAIPISKSDSDWEKTYSGRLFNHRFGYGKLDTEVLIKNAKKFEHVNKQVSYVSPITQVEKEMTGQSEIESIINITKENVESFKHLEHINVQVNIKHQRRGDIVIDLVSPHKIVSHLATERRKDSSEAGFKDWKFMSVKHWDEDPIGEWKLIVRNKKGTVTKGTFNNWTLTLWGEELSEEDKKKMKTPNEDEKKSSSEIISTTTTSSITTTTEKDSIEVSTTTLPQTEETTITSSGTIPPSQSTESSVPSENGDEAGAIDPERTHEAVVAAEFAVGAVGMIGMAFVIWRFTRSRRSYREDIEFQMLDQQQQQLMAGDDDDDDDEDSLDEEGHSHHDDSDTKYHNQLIFENHFLDEEEEEDEEVEEEEARENVGMSEENEIHESMTKVQDSITPSNHPTSTSTTTDTTNIDIL